MRKILVVLCLAFSLFLMGCNGGQRVVNNQYQTMGFPNFTVDNDFAYVGSPHLEDLSKCTGVDCRTFDNAQGKITSDLFVTTVDGKVTEVVTFERNQTPSGYRWLPLEGPKVRFGGKEYVERFLAITREEDGGAYALMLRNAGYEFDGHNMAVRMIKRNISNSNSILVAYACSEALIPESIKNDDNAVREFMRQRFEERVTLPE